MPEEMLKEENPSVENSREEILPDGGENASAPVDETLSQSGEFSSSESENASAPVDEALSQGGAFSSGESENASAPVDEASSQGGEFSSGDSENQSDTVDDLLNPEQDEVNDLPTSSRDPLPEEYESGQSLGRVHDRERYLDSIKK